VYFHHKVVENWGSFDDLRRGQVVEYTLENIQSTSATFVGLLTIIPANVERPAA
jgi:hypothetical protein